MKYVAPRWLPGGQLQTIWPALYSRRVFGPRPVYRRERWDTPDGDFIDIDLISIGLVSEDGRATFYAERNDYRRAAVSDFVREAVLPHLGQQRPGALTSVMSATT